MYFIFFFFKQKTAYEMRISDWSSDVCSSDLDLAQELQSIICEFSRISSPFQDEATVMSKANFFHTAGPSINPRLPCALAQITNQVGIMTAGKPVCQLPRSSFPGYPSRRSEEHTSELQSLMRISYAVFCLKKT